MNINSKENIEREKNSGSMGLITLLQVENVFIFDLCLNKRYYYYYHYYYYINEIHLKIRT